METGRLIMRLLSRMRLLLQDQILMNAQVNWCRKVAGECPVIRYIAHAVYFDHEMVANAFYRRSLEISQYYRYASICSTSITCQYIVLM